MEVEKKYRHAMEIPRGWWKLDILGEQITDGIDTMTYVIGYGYILD